MSWRVLETSTVAWQAGQRRKQTMVRDGKCAILRHAQINTKPTKSTSQYSTEDKIWIVLDGFRGEGCGPWKPSYLALLSKLTLCSSLHGRV